MPWGAGCTRVGGGINGVINRFVVVVVDGYVCPSWYDRGPGGYRICYFEEMKAGTWSS